MDAPRARVARIARVAPHTIHTHTISQSPPRQPSRRRAARLGRSGAAEQTAEGDWRRRPVGEAGAGDYTGLSGVATPLTPRLSAGGWQQQRRATSRSASCCQEGAQCSNLTGITSPDNQTRSWLTSQNNQKVVLTGIQYHFGPGAETGPDRPSRALEPSDRHLHTPKQPFHFKYHLFSCRIRPSPAVSGRFRPFSYVFQSIGAVRCRGSRLNTAPLELKRIKLESGIRKYQLTIPLSKSIKEWSIPL